MKRRAFVSTVKLEPMSWAVLVKATPYAEAMEGMS